MTPHILATDNQGLAYEIAMRYYRAAHRAVPLDQLQSEALLSLVVAANAYQPERGLKFSTLAWLSISRRLRQFTDTWFRRSKARPFSTLTDNEERGLDPACHQPGPLEQVMQAEDENRARDKVGKLLASVDYRHRIVLRRRMADVSYREIARELGVSHQRAVEMFRQVQRRQYAAQS